MNLLARTGRFLADRPSVSPILALVTIALFVSSLALASTMPAVSLGSAVAVVVLLFSARWWPGQPGATHDRGHPAPVSTPTERQPMKISMVCMSVVNFRLGGAPNAHKLLEVTLANDARETNSTLTFRIKMDDAAKYIVGRSYEVTVAEQPLDSTT